MWRFGGKKEGLSNAPRSADQVYQDLVRKFKANNLSKEEMEKIEREGTPDEKFALTKLGGGVIASMATGKKLDKWS